MKRSGRVVIAWCWTDQRVRVVQLKAMASFGKIEQVGYGIRDDRRLHQRRLGCKHTEHREPACRPAKEHCVLRRTPTLMMRRSDDVADVTHVDVAPATIDRLLIRASVARGSPMIGHEHVPSERSPIGDARHKRDLPLIGGATMQPAQQAIGGLVGAIEPSMDRGSIA